MEGAEEVSSNEFGCFPCEVRLEKWGKHPTGAHNVCFHQEQDDIRKTRSGNKDWEFVSIGTEISLDSRRVVFGVENDLVISHSMTRGDLDACS
jgi:hypothetical protein